MLVAAIAAAVLERKTLARDYLGAVSSLVREGGRADMPQGGVGGDGLRRSRRMAKMRVRLGDVGRSEGYGVGVGAALSVGKLGVGGGEQECTREK